MRDLQTIKHDNAIGKNTSKPMVVKNRYPHVEALFKPLNKILRQQRLAQRQLLNSPW